VTNITDKQLNFGRNPEKTLSDQGLRAHCDLRNDRFGLKIRVITPGWVLYMLVNAGKMVEFGQFSMCIRDTSGISPLKLGKY